MKITPFLIIFVLFSLISCKKESKDSPFQTDSTVVNFYADSTIVYEEMIMGDKDTLKFRHQIDSLRSNYNLTTEKVHLALVSYQKDMLHWRDFYEKVLKRIEYLQQLETSKPKR